MSIVHILSSLGVGGQERVALDLAAAAVAAGFPTAVISLAAEPGGPLADEFANAGVGVFSCPKRGSLDITLVPRLARLLKKLGATIVHTHNPLPLVYGAPAGRLVRARVIHTKHGLNPSGTANLVLRSGAALLTDAFVAVSEVTAAQAREKHEAPTVLVIPNGIRLDRFRPDDSMRAAVRNEFHIPLDAWTVGTIGRLDDFKNQPMLIDAMKPLLAHGAHLLIVGDGPMRTDVDAAAAAAGPNVHVVGRRMDVARMLAAMDVFALPSKTEGLPLVVPEAMASSLPVVCTRVGGLPDVIEEGVTGHLIDVDPLAMRRALTSLRENPSLAHAMGEAARRTALSRYSAERMWTDYKALYGLGTWRGASLSSP